MITLKKLRRSREARKLSRKQLASKARVTVHAIYWAEHGRTITQARAQAIATALGIQLKSLRS